MYLLFSKQKYIIGSTCAQIFIDEEGFVYVHPMKYKSQAGGDLNVVTKDIGVPNTLISENSGEQTGPQIELQKFVRRCCIYVRTTEPYSPWHNIAKGTIKITKVKTKRRIIYRRVLKCVWYLGLVWEV